MGLYREGDMRAQIEDGHTRGNGVANVIVRVLLPSAVRRMRSSRRLVVHEGVIRCSVAVVASVAGLVLEGRWPPRLISWQESTRSVNTYR